MWYKNSSKWNELVTVLQGPKLLKLFLKQLNDWFLPGIAYFGALTNAFSMHW